MKFVGSKARIGKDIFKILKTYHNGEDYVEPFAGGLNMMQHVSFPNRFAFDSNKYLVAMWKELLNGWDPPKSITRDFYAKCKSLDEEEHVIGYVGFNASYCGAWFGGYAGLTKTKDGERDYQLEAYNNIKKQLPKLKGVKIDLSDYSNLLPRNSIVYCDPPYEGTRKYHDEFNHNDFWNWVRLISKTNKVFVSEYSAPDDFEVVWQKELTSSFSANGDVGGAKKSVEKLFKLREDDWKI